MYIYVDARNEYINLKGKEERITWKCEEMQKEIERGEKVLILVEREGNKNGNGAARSLSFAN